MSEWLTEGARVAVVYGGTNIRAELAVVERLTKTQVVVSGRRTRFYRESLEAIGSRDSWWSTQLRPVDAPEVIDALAAQAVDSLFHRLEQLNRERSRATRNREGSADALGQIEALIAETRAALDGAK